MLGAICTQDVLFHPIATIRAFGWRVFFRAVFQGQGDTFLSLLQSEGLFAAPPAPRNLNLLNDVFGWNCRRRRSITRWPTFFLP